MSARLLSRTRNLTSPCTCSTLYRLPFSCPSPSTSALQPFSTSTSTSNAPKDDQWKPLRPPANRRAGGGRAGGRDLSQQKIYAQDRQRERLMQVNLEKPKYANEERGRGPARGRPGPRPVRNGNGETQTQGERLLRSARAVGMGPSDVGSGLDQQRDKSRKWKRSPEGPNDLPQFKGGGIGSKMVPGRINRSMQGQERKEQPVGRIGGGGAAQRPGQERRRPKQAKVLKKVALPSALRLDNLCNILKMKLCTSSYSLQTLRPEY